MNWLVFAFFGFVALVLDLSAAKALMIGGVEPSFVLVLVVYVALLAPRATALWAAWAIGLAVDLNTPVAHDAAHAVPLIGPGALGYLAATLVILQFRTMLFRRRALTVAVMTFLAGLAVTAAVVVLAIAHSLYDGGEGAWAGQLSGQQILRRIGVALYSGLVALPLAPLLVRTGSLLGFRSGPQRSAMMR